MPAIVGKLIIGNELLDKRVKFLKSDKLEIVDLYASGLFSQLDLAKLYKVSRRSIQFTIAPSKLVENKARRTGRGGSKQYYNKQGHTKTIREYRRYEQELLAKGERLKKC